jgi:hypothetical protein
VACNSSVCAITGCSAPYFNVDGVCGNGCECKATPQVACSAPTALVLSGVGTSNSTGGNLVPIGSSTWYAVSFTGYNASTFHPKIALTTNPGGEYLFDVETNCSGGDVLCQELTDAGASAHSVGLTVWEKSYNSGVDFVDSGFLPIPSLGTLLVHVYRAGAAPVDCNSYTLTVSN